MLRKQEGEYLRAENAILKKLRELRLKEEKETEIVQELMTEFSLDILLKAIKLARSTYYYHLKQLDKTDKDQELKAEIQSIFIKHKGNYAYRRVHLELRNRAYLVNHKRVQGLMKVLKSFTYHQF
ncbi:transposase InsK for insertion sequence [Streptococcus pneumoniae]|nr:transposase InsK for insertion sequence [Streptococcus pneumoniae]